MSRPEGSSRAGWSSPLTALSGVGPTRAKQLAAAGYRTVGELLSGHLPLRFEDRRQVAAVAEARAGGVFTLRGRLQGARPIRTRRRGFTLVRSTLVDETGELPVVWFNRPYLARSLDPDTVYVLHGDVREHKSGAELVNPSVEPAAEAVHGARVAPVYPSAGELSPSFLRRLLTEALGQVDLAAAPEPLPQELLLRHRLPPLGAALEALHRPADDADVEALDRADSPAHRRLVYGELLELALQVALLRERETGEEQAFRIRVDDRVRQVAREVLPFSLTRAQKRVLKEIVDDMKRPRPMLRLLQGDVGSGKTVVAALALVVALESGLQGAVMAPTELLAEQHFRTLSDLLGGRYRIALVTGSSTGVRDLSKGLARGYFHLAVGTHALLEEGVEFERLGLVVIDEQHRFGVAQRQRLATKGKPGHRPDVLVMTATPIPRSLALTVYGDLELSVIDELPPGRRPVETTVLPATRRRQAVELLRAELAAGGRAYAVFPLIEESGQVQAASVEARGEELRRAFPDVPSAVLTGRMNAAQRDRVMASFAAGEVRLLVATTVIEVGVDVPEATLMWIDSGERFGLAQLHQLRGRIGRGDKPSRCVVLHGPLTPEGEQRLEVFARTQDGFEIAEADLTIRGPGEVLGTRQSGLPTLRIADLVRDRDWLLRARDDARELLGRWDHPELAALRRRIEPRVEARVSGWVHGA